MKVPIASRKNTLFFWISIAITVMACSAVPTTPVHPPVSETTAPSMMIASETPILLDTPLSIDTITPLTTDSPLRPIDTFTPSPVLVVESLEAQVVADLLSCRYGPGAEYLYLYGLRKGANIKLIGRTDANSWVIVDGRNKCWVNKKFIEIQGDPTSLKILYPYGYKLPISPYYPPTVVLSATRNENTVTVKWMDVPLRAGDEEDESMLHYIIEVWRCEGGQIIFDPLGTNELSISFVDEPGCTQPSHGRVFVQEKHGFAGPSEIPWPKRIP